MLSWYLTGLAGIIVNNSKFHQILPCFHFPLIVLNSIPKSKSVVNSNRSFSLIVSLILMSLFSVLSVRLGTPFLLLQLFFAPFALVTGLPFLLMYSYFLRLV